MSFFKDEELEIVHFNKVFRGLHNESNTQTSNSTAPENFSWHPSTWSSHDKHVVIALSIWMSLTLVILLSFTFFSCRKRVNVKTVNASKLLERQQELALKEIEKTKMIVKEACFKEALCMLETISDDNSALGATPNRSPLNIGAEPTVINGNPKENDLPSNFMLALPETDMESMKSYPNGGPRLVPNLCAICLRGYKIGEFLCWSANIECCHVFHFECISKWLHQSMIRNPEASNCECPCCRHLFVQWEENVD